MEQRVGRAVQSAMFLVQRGTAYQGHHLIVKGIKIFFIHWIIQSFVQYSSP